MKREHKPSNINSDTDFPSGPVYDSVRLKITRSFVTYQALLKIRKDFNISSGGFKSLFEVRDFQKKMRESCREFWRNKEGIDAAKNMADIIALTEGLPGYAFKESVISLCEMAGLPERMEGLVESYILCEGMPSSDFLDLGSITGNTLTPNVTRQTQRITYNIVSFFGRGVKRGLRFKVYDLLTKKEGASLIREINECLAVFPGKKKARGTKRDVGRELRLLKGIHEDEDLLDTYDNITGTENIEIDKRKFETLRKAKERAKRRMDNK